MAKKQFAYFKESCEQQEHIVKKPILVVILISFLVAGALLDRINPSQISHHLLISLNLVFIILISLLGGIRSGLAATLISAVAVKYFWDDSIFWKTHNLPNSVGMIVFIAAGFIISTFTGLIRWLHTRIAAAETKAAFFQELQQSEENLRCSEERLQQALHVSHSFVFEWSPESDLVRRSGSCCDILGLSVEDAVCATGKEFFQSITPEDRIVLLNKLASLTPENDTYEVLYEYLRRDGQKLMLEECGKAFFDENGAVIRLSGISTDVTVREEALRKLNESEKRYRLFSEAIPAMLWACDADGNIVDHNGRWYEYTGLSPDKPTESWKEVLHPDDLQRIAEIWRNAKLTGLSCEAEYRIKRGVDGSYRWHMVQGVPLKDDSGLIIGWYGTCLDIEDRRQAEKGLKEAHDLLEKQIEERTMELDMTIVALREEIADRVKTVEELHSKDRLLIQQNRLAAMGEMVNNIAHQWRQPLNTLGLNIQRVSLFYELGEFNQEFLDKSTQEAMDLIQHMSQTIDDFRNFFRPDKEKVSFSIDDAINRTVALIEGSFRNLNLNIYSRSNGEAIIKGYQNEFCQALLNIIQNARDALVTRKIKDGVLLISTVAQNGKTKITIKDNAGGIPEEVIDKIFEPYFSTKGLQGTGIGLFMSKKIIESSMGGRITARNADSGAEFILEFTDDPYAGVGDMNKQIPLF